MKRFIFALLFICLLSGSALAVEEGAKVEYGIDELEGALPDEVDELLGELSVDDATDTGGLLSRLWAAVRERAVDAFKSGAAGAAAVLLVALACALAATVFGEGNMPEYITLAGCAAVATAAASGVQSLIGLGVDAIDKLSTFSRVLLPTLCTVAASSGAVTSASAKYAATALFMEILITVSRNVIVPLIYAYIAATLASAAAGGTAIKSVTKLIKWLCITLMTVLTVVFTTYLTVTGAVSGSADVVATKVAKTAISAALPVVGGIVSDAAASVVAGAGILRNAVGVLGLAAVCCICLGPFLALGAQYLMYKAAAACASALPTGRIADLIGGIGDACGMMLGLTGCAGAMLFISIISSIRTVSGV